MKLTMVEFHFVFPVPGVADAAYGLFWTIKHNV